MAIGRKKKQLVSLPSYIIFTRKKCTIERGKNANGVQPDKKRKKLAIRKEISTQTDIGEHFFLNESMKHRQKKKRERKNE